MQEEREETDAETGRGRALKERGTHRWKVQRLDTRQRQGEDKELDDEKEDAGEKREMHRSADRSTNRLTNICPFSFGDFSFPASLRFSLLLFPFLFSLTGGWIIRHE